MKHRTNGGSPNRKQHKKSVSAVQQPSSSQQALQSSRKEVGRAAAALEQAREREKKAVERLRAVKARAQNPNSAVSRKAASRLRERVETAAARRAEAAANYREAAANYREAKALANEQEAFTKALKRKERAREKAVAAFIKKWDKEYDAAQAFKKKNIALRKNITRD